MKDFVEIERKYVIKLPQRAVLACLDGYSESEILQIYLKGAPGLTHRVRRRTEVGVSVFTETKKRRIDKMSSFEDECEIDEQRFSELAKEQREGSMPILKRRITFIYEERLFEIDIYPSWTKSCIMEIELSTREEEIIFPPFIEIIADVTGEKAYSNSSMSQKFPDELI